MFDSFFVYLQLLMTVGLIYLSWSLQSEFKAFKKQMETLPVKNEEGNKLKLQSLERLTLFAERCGLAALVARLDCTGLSAPEYHHILTSTIKSEYEYNISQQVYVSPEVWNAVSRLKDQNVYVINHITANLAPHATSLDLSKLILEYSNTPNAEMNVIVLDALQYEAKKILN